MKTNYLIPLTLLTGAILIAGFVLKPTPNAASFASGYLPIWKNAITSTIQVAEAMPEDTYNYKPAPESKTFAEQIVHIGNSSQIMAKMFLKGEEVEFKEPNASEMSKAEIVDLLKKNLNAVTEIIESMPANEWDVKVKSFGGNMMPKSQAMIFIQDHLTNHRAKANLYIRINGIKPPSYMYY